MRNLLVSFCLFFFTATFAQFPTTYNDSSSSSKLEKNTTAHSFQKSTKFSFGVHLSPTISWFEIKHNDLHTDGAAITGGIGLIAEYNTNRLFSLVSGLNFNMPTGYAFDANSMTDLTTRNNFLLKFYTLEVPILLKIKTLPIDNIIYYTQGGLNAGYRISSKELHYASSSAYNDVHSSFNSYSNPFQLSYSIGFGASYQTNRNHSVFGEVNYKSSLVNLASKDGFTTTVPEIYSGSMVFTLGVMF